MNNIMLNKFYKDDVKITKLEIKHNADFVIPLVNSILQNVHELDERFKTQPLHVGSYYSRLKVSRADEFDYSVVLDTISSLSWIPETPVYYGYHRNREVDCTSIPLATPPVGKCLVLFPELIQIWNNEGLNNGSACLSIDGSIIPIKVKKWFKQLVIKAIDQLGLRDIVKVQGLPESPATTLTICHSKIAGGTISVDLTPIIEAKLSFIPKFCWPRAGATWPSDTKIQEIKDEGIHVVAKDPYYWSLSFVACEKKLIAGIDSDGSCRKKSQRIMKKLREMWCPKETKQELTSYHLKNILFWECENHPDNKEWNKDQLAVRIESMCHLLIHYIRCGNLPLYFHTGVNLFENKDKDVLGQVAHNILRFVMAPHHYLDKYR